MGVLNWFNWLRFPSTPTALPLNLQHPPAQPSHALPTPSVSPPHAHREPPMGSRTVQLYETSQRFSTLVQHSPLAVIEWDPEHRITKWMGNAETIFGWPALEVLDRRLEEVGLIYPDDINIVRTALAALKESKSNVVCNRNCRKDGTVITCEWYNSAMIDSTGELAWGLSVALDITARLQAEQAFRANERRLVSIYNTVEDVIFHLAVEADGQFRFVSVNAAFLRITGLLPEAVIGKTVSEVIPEPSLTLVLEKYRQVVEEKTIVRWEETSDYPSGRLVGEVRVAPVLDHNGTCTHLVGSVHNITERKRAEEALREAHDALERRVADRTAELSAANEHLKELDRLKSQFLASMSHELRTPLNSIIGFTSLLRRGLSGPVNDEQAKQLGIVQSSASHLLGLINDLLDLSRIEAGKADLQCEPFDFVEVINEVVRTMQPMGDQKGLAIVISIHQAAIPMHTDRKRTVQILLNLVSNAVKFTTTGSVTIVATTSATTLYVEVADTGIGIKAEHLGMLFEAFRQVDGSAKRVYEGTGLGLYLCRKLLDLMGGEIRVESEYGKGSRFIYSMPLELHG